MLWRRFDNATGATSDVGTTTAAATSVTAPADLPSAIGTYVRADISANGGEESWGSPAHAYFLREAAGWKLVGFERIPFGAPPRTEAANARKGN